LRLSIYLGTTPKFWLDLLDDYDLEEEIIFKDQKIKNIRRYSSRVA